MQTDKQPSKQPSKQESEQASSSSSGSSKKINQGDNQKTIEIDNGNGKVRDSSNNSIETITNASGNSKYKQRHNDRIDKDGSGNKSRIHNDNSLDKGKCISKSKDTDINSNICLTLPTVSSVSDSAVQQIDTELRKKNCTVNHKDIDIAIDIHSYSDTDMNNNGTCHLLRTESPSQDFTVQQIGAVLEAELKKESDVVNHHNNDNTMDNHKNNHTNVNNTICPPLPIASSASESVVQQSCEILDAKLKQENDSVNHNDSNHDDDDNISAIGKNINNTNNSNNHNSIDECIRPHFPTVPATLESAVQRIGKVLDAELNREYDLVVIGGGPAGVAGALKASTLGYRCLLVDKPRSKPNKIGLDISFGGPSGLFSKALREAGKAIDIASLRSMGLYENLIWSQVQGMCENLASLNAEHQVKLLKDFKVGYVQGHAMIEAPSKIRVKMADGCERIITAEKILVATGSKPLRPPNIPFDDMRVFDSDTVNTLAFLPKQVVISGGGIISIEYAKIFRKLGAEVTLIVRSSVKSSLERIGLDRDIADQLLYFLQHDAVTIYEGTEVQMCEVHSDGKIQLGLKRQDARAPAEVLCDIFLVAVGRRPNVSGTGIEQLGVKLAEKGHHIEVDDTFQTSIPGIFAVGDVIGPPSLASTGVYQAHCAVAAMFDQGHFERCSSFPVGMWTTPECAYYGLTKQNAFKNGLDVEEGLAKYTSCLRGRVFAPDGLLKLVFQKTDGVIVGVHIIGSNACELVHYGMDLVEQRVTIFSLMSTLFTAVTFHELFKEAAVDGNSKLEFGVNWQTILAELGASFANSNQDLSEELLHREFKAMDTSGDGSLDADELQALFQNLGKDVKKGTIANLVRLADEDGNGTIEWGEFLKIFKVAACHTVNKDVETAVPTKDSTFSSCHVLPQGWGG